MDNDGFAICVGKIGKRSSGGADKKNNIHQKGGEQEAIVDDNGVLVPNSKIRKVLYRTFTFEIWSSTRNKK